MILLCFFPLLIYVHIVMSLPFTCWWETFIFQTFFWCYVFLVCISLRIDDAPLWADCKHSDCEICHCIICHIWLIMDVFSVRPFICGTSWWWMYLCGYVPFHHSVHHPTSCRYLIIWEVFVVTWPRSLSVDICSIIWSCLCLCGWVSLYHSVHFSTSCWYLPN